MPADQAELAPGENSVQESWVPCDLKKKKKKSFLRRICLHSVNLFIIYGGVKDMKLTVNWINSKFYWHFLVIIIKTLCLT